MHDFDQPPSQFCRRDTSHPHALMLRYRSHLENAMLHIPLDPAVERTLASIAARTGDAPEELARQALLKYLEDLEDYAVAVERWREFNPATTLSTEEMLRELGVAD